MSRPTRGRPPPWPHRDPWGRLTLLLGAIFLFAVGLSRGNAFDHLFFIATGVLLLILFAFYSRISGALSIGKFQIPIIGEQNPRLHEPSQAEARPELEVKHRPSLSEVEEKARRPATQRSRPH